MAKKRKKTRSKVVATSLGDATEPSGNNAATWLRIALDLKSFGGWFPHGEGRPQITGRYGESLPRMQRKRKRPERSQTTLHRHFHFLNVVNRWLWYPPVHPDSFDASYRDLHWRVLDALDQCGAPRGWIGEPESEVLRKEVIAAAFYLNVLTWSAAIRFAYDAPYNAQLGVARELLGLPNLTRSQLDDARWRTWEVLVRRCGYLGITADDNDKPKQQVHLVMPAFRDQLSNVPDAQAIRWGVDGAIGSFFYLLALRETSGRRLCMRSCKHALNEDVVCGDLFVAVGNTSRCANHATTDPLAASELKAKQDRERAQVWNKTRGWLKRESLLRDWHSTSSSATLRIQRLRTILGASADTAPYYAYRKAWPGTNKVPE